MILRVSLPVPAAVRGPRSVRHRYGWIWVERDVEVPNLRSEATCTVLPAVRRHRGAQRASGACADGRHWRTTTSHPHREGSSFRPFKLVRVGGRAPTAAFEVEATGTLGNVVTVGPKGDRAVRAASRAIEWPTAVDGATQAQLRRAFGTTESVGSLTSASGTHLPFDLKSSAVATTFDDGAFEATLTDRVRERIAVVDGVPMVASPPPVTIVTARGADLHVDVGYADHHPMSVRDAATVLPLADLEGTRADLAALTSDPGAFRRGTFQGFVVGPGDGGGIDGSVVTPYEPVHRARRADGALVWDGDSYVDGLVRYAHEPTFRNDLGDVFVPGPNGPLVGLTALTRWRHDLPDARPVAPSAPDALDALDAPGP